ncbi:G polyprotein, partial [Dissostichus eleginoides]
EDHQQHTGHRLHTEKGRRHLCSHRCAECLFRCEGRPERVAGASETWHGDKGYSAQQTVSVSKPLGQMATVCQGDGPLPGST